MAARFWFEYEVNVTFESLKYVWSWRSLSGISIQSDVLEEEVGVGLALEVQNQNENELYWPGMFTHTRNLL